MKQTRILSVIIILLALSACEGGWSSSRYQLLTTPDGKVYRLDAKRGSVHYVTTEKMQALNDGLPTLHIGEYYQMGDADGNSKYLKYLGNGQFEKSQATSQVK